MSSGEPQIGAKTRKTELRQANPQQVDQDPGEKSR